MKHVKAITEIYERGERDEALAAIESLLELGPGNTDALKLKARIFASMGKHNEEAMVWQRVLKIDRDDEDGIAYLQHQQDEDREHFYFTDPLPEGGRRYLAYPKQLLYSSAAGLLGCLSFFLLSRHIGRFPQEYGGIILLGAFSVFVLGPWLSIIWGWARSLRSVAVNQHGIVAETRLKRIGYHWHELAEVVIAYEDSPDDLARLTLVLRPRRTEQPELHIDISEGSSALRAKEHLIREISVLYGRVGHCPMAVILASNRPCRRY